MEAPIAMARSEVVGAGATPAEWAHWQRLGLTADLLPVCSDRAVPISPQSAMTATGKTPSIVNGSGQAAGIPRWTQRRSTDADVERWAKDSRLGVCIQTRTVRALDIDIADPAQAADVVQLIELGAGSMPMRTRANSGRCLLLFRMPGEFAKRVIRTPHGVIEFLGTGQQFVACGQHPSGERYQWPGGLPAAILELAPAEFEALWQALIDQFALEGGSSTGKAPIALQRPRCAADAADPDAAAWLYEHGHVVGEQADGKLNVRCPWEAEHSTDTGPSSTSYMPAGLGGQALAGFRCLHAHCIDKNIFDYRRAVGLDDPAEDFDVVEAAPNATEVDQVRGWITVIDSVTGELVEIVTPAFSDDRMSLEFATRAAASFRWTPGMGWMANDGQQWARDDNLLRFGTARATCRKFAALADKPHERKALASAKTINAIVQLAQSDQRLTVPVGAWDADKFALNTPDGMVDLRTGELRPRCGDLVTRRTVVAPDFGAECPHWLAFMHGVSSGDAELVEFLQRLIGYMLTGDRREQKLFFIWGRGSNGKSTLGELMLWLLGGYGMKLSSSVLMQSAHDRHPTELAQLQGIRAAVSSELEEGQFFNEARVKELTGDDTLSARFMRGDFFEFGMSHKHLVLGNHKPRLKGGDPAMALRLVLIPFRAAFSAGSADQDLPAKLRGEGPAILAWAIRGAVAWAAGGLPLPAVVREASAEYMADHNDVEQWIDECCDRGAQMKDKAGALYASFSQWKVSRGERAPSAVTWGERMSLVPELRKFRSNGVHYAGVHLRTGIDACEFA